MKIAGALSIPVAIVGIFISQAGLNLRLRPETGSSRSAQAEEAGFRKWDPRIFRILSFGLLPAAVDWQWIKVLLDPSVTRLARGTHPSIYYDLDLVTDLDPAFFEVYFTGSQLLAIVRDDPSGARDLLEKSDRFRKQELPKWPERIQRRLWAGGWYLSVTLAYIHLFELDDMPRAAEAFVEASTQPGAPPYLQRLAERLKKPGGQYEVGLKLLNFMISQDPEPKVKERLERQRQSLFISQYVFDLNHAFLEYRTHLSRAMEAPRAWEQYRRENGLSSRDPWGGTLSLGSDGRIATSTPHEKVFGLE